MRICTQSSSSSSGRLSCLVATPSGCSTSYIMQDSNHHPAWRSHTNSCCCGCGNQNDIDDSGARLLSISPHVHDSENPFLPKWPCTCFTYTTPVHVLTLASSGYILPCSTRNPAYAPWAPPCSRRHLWQAFQVPCIDRAHHFQLTLNKPSPQPSCCLGSCPVFPSDKRSRTFRK